MNNTAGAKTINLKWFGTLSLRQMLGLIAAFALALFLTLYGFGYSCSCFGMLIIAIILLMLPKMLGVEDIKLMTLVGVLFTVSAILIGGLVTAPAMVEENQGSPPDSGCFKDVEFTYTSDGIDISAVLTKEAGSHKVYFKYGEVKGVPFTGANAVIDMKSELNVSGSAASDSVSLDRDKLYIGYLSMTKTDDSGDEVDDAESHTFWRFLTGAYDGDATPLCLWGCFWATLYITVIFFMVMIFSNIMRGRMEKTRERMEKEGRLYPKGYGRCDRCGATVLPGEVNCRKCGAYIDRPDEMKPKKKDFFECSECGAEVPSDAKQCPKCNAAFDDDDEFEVVHADGKVETTKETFTCPECGATVPGTASFCTKCGAKFNKK